MKRIIILTLLALFLPFTGRLGEVFAQVRIGYISYDTVLKQMPEYAEAQKSVADLKVKYEQEATRGEEEFQRKFSEFLQGQKEFPENILIKRQAELQALMEAGIKFRNEANDLLQKAEGELMAGVMEKLNEALRTVGFESGYACIINTDNNNCPFINPIMGEDATQAVLRQLGLVTEESTVSEKPTNAE